MHVRSRRARKRSVRQDLGRYSKNRAYKFQPANARAIHQVLTEVKIIHHRIEESKRVAWCRIDTEERDDIRVRELTRRPGLLEEPLRVPVSTASTARTGYDSRCRPLLDQTPGSSNSGGISPRRPDLATTHATLRRSPQRKKRLCR